MNIVSHNNTDYPAWTANGNAARFILPFALEVCKGNGIDVGASQWCFPNAIPVEPSTTPYHATNYPYRDLDFVFSSHCLEHTPNWVDALDYWIDSIKPGGHIFLYLPHFDETYWRPWHNRKHIHCFTPNIIEAYLKDRKDVCNVFVSQRDLNYSFAAVAQKKLTGEG